MIFRIMCNIMRGENRVSRLSNRESGRGSTVSPDGENTDEVAPVVQTEDN